MGKMGFTSGACIPRVISLLCHKFNTVNKGGLRLHSGPWSKAQSATNSSSASAVPLKCCQHRALAHSQLWCFPYSLRDFGSLQCVVCSVKASPGDEVWAGAPDPVGQTGSKVGKSRWSPKAETPEPVQQNWEWTHGKSKGWGFPLQKWILYMMPMSSPALTLLSTHSSSFWAVLSPCSPLAPGADWAIWIFSIPPPTEFQTLPLGTTSW